MACKQKHFSEITWFSINFYDGLYALCKTYPYRKCSIRKRYPGRQALHIGANVKAEKNAYHSIWLPVNIWVYRISANGQ